MKDVVIDIVTEQFGDGDDWDLMEFSTDGEYIFDGESGCFSYMESELTGLEGTRTSVAVTPEEIVVDREGCVTGRMIFREGTKTSFLYDTPYGAAMLGIDTRKIKHSFNEQGGSLEIDYVVNMEHTIVSRNIFKINITEQKREQQWQI